MTAPATQPTISIDKNSSTKHELCCRAVLSSLFASTTPLQMRIYQHLFISNIFLIVISGVDGIEWSAAILHWKSWQRYLVTTIAHLLQSPWFTTIQKLWSIGRKAKLCNRGDRRFWTGMNTRPPPNFWHAWNVIKDQCQNYRNSF